MSHQKIKMSDKIAAEVERQTGLKNQVQIGSVWDWEIWRQGKMIDSWRDHNLCTDQGIEDLLDVYFSDGTQTNTHYIALFSDNHTPAAGNTYATPGYTESTAYDEAARQTWTEAGVSSKSITNSASKASFTMSTAVTIYGGALVSSATKGDTAASGAKLFCVSQFDGGSKVLSASDVLKVTVTISGADS